MEDALWRALSKHVRQRRRALELTQDQLAQRSGLSEPIVRKIENHKDGTGHRRETLEKLSHGLGEKPEYLYEYKQTLLILGPDATPDPLPVALIQPSQSDLEPASELALVVPRINELMMECLNELVVPRLDRVEKKVQEIWRMVHDAGSPGDPDMRQRPAAPE